MRTTVDVRTVGWRTDCEYEVKVDDSYQDDSGQTIYDYKWESRLRCEVENVNAKTDYCKTCGKHLLYP
ncbi:hypothetical protein [Pseudomonas serbica]|jgi:hypothetical protein|uniref:hypothetical protein n=1 Tax=Pseudomonas serbica TaxID=2965074 RepID=UPI00237B7EFC|nr:hypothetical protein [Pseudomonas serbica]